MKSLKLTAILALAAFCAPMVTSCGSDDNDAPDSPNKSEVSDIDGTRVTGVGDCTVTYDSKGRPTVFNIEDDGIMTIDYSKGTFIGSDEMGKMNIKFNAKGFVTELSSSWNYKFTEDGITVQAKGSGTLTCSYENDVLKSIKATESSSFKAGQQSYETKGTSIMTLIWSNNNLTAIKSSEDYTKNGEKEHHEAQAKIEYGTQTNKFRQFPMAIADESEAIIPYFYSVGLVGNGPANLPVSMVVEDEEGRYSSSISYVLNPNGSIKSESTKRGSSKPETWDYTYSDITRSLMPAANKQLTPEMIRDIFLPRHARK